MRNTMQTAWQQIKEHSPNRRLSTGQISLVQFSRLNRQAMCNLLYAIGAAASAKPT
jgi:hypothetical protein